MPEKFERKSIACELKTAASNDDKMRFEGYLARFDNVDSYGDVILKGAFVKTLSATADEGKTIPVLEQHGGWGISSSDHTPIGYFESLAEDDTGLYVKGVLFSTARGMDMYKLLKEAPQGAMGMSIGYRTVGQKKPTEEEHRAKGVVRYLTELKLLEGSIVTFPANDAARVESVKAEALHWRELEKHFRKNGFSSSEAVKAVALVKEFKGAQATGDITEKDDDGIELISVIKSFSDSVSDYNFRKAMKDIFSQYR